MTGHLRTNGGDPKWSAESRSRNGTRTEQVRTPPGETSLRDVSRILFRHRRKVFGFFAFVMAAAIAYLYASPREYRSEAKLFVRLGRENVGLDATTTLGQTPQVAIPVSREEEINSVVEVLSSRALLERVVDSLGPQAILHPVAYAAAEGRASAPEKPKPTKDSDDADDIDKGGQSWLQELGLASSLTPRERAVIALRKQVGIEAIKKTNVILVSHEGRSAKVSQQIVAKLIDIYLAEHVRMNRTPHAHEFLTEQAVTLKAELNAMEDELRLLKNSTGLASPAEQRLMLVAQIGRLEDELKTTQALVAATQAETKELARRLTTIAPTQVLGESAGNPNAAADGMRQQLYALQLKEKELSSRVTDKHVELKMVREQIASAKSVLDSLDPTRTQTTVGPNKTYEELRLAQVKQEAALASLTAKAATLGAQLAESKHRLEMLNNSELRIAQLQRDIQIRDASYRKYADSLEQSRIDESLERQRISNINVAQPPTLSRQPVQPKPAVVLIVGFAAALFGSLGLALAAEYFDHTLKTAEEVEHRLGVPVLASIPRTRNRPDFSRVRVLP